MNSLEVHVDIHDDGKRFIHVEFNGSPVERKNVPRFLKLIAEDLEQGNCITEYAVKP